MCTLTHDDIRDIEEKREMVLHLMSHLSEGLLRWTQPLLNGSQDTLADFINLEMAACDFVRALEAYKKARFPEVLNEKGGRG